MDPERKLELQRTNLDALVRNGAFRFTDTFFPYTSGQIGSFYIEGEKVRRDGNDRYKAVTALAALIYDVYPGLKEAGAGKDFVV